MTRSSESRGSYTLRLAAIGGSWTLLAGVVIWVWQPPTRQTLLASGCGASLGAAAALADLEKIPWMIHRSTLDPNRDLPLSRLVVKPINFLLFLAVIPTWLFGFSFRPELGVPLVGVLAVVISYVLILALVLGRREFLYGNMIRESVFPGSIGLPEQARGALIVVRSAEADLGDSVINGEVWEVRSAFGEDLIPGHAATIVALDGATLLVTQQASDAG